MVRSTTTYSLLFINRAQSCKSDVKPPDLGANTLTEASRSKTMVVRRERRRLVRVRSHLNPTVMASPTRRRKKPNLSKNIEPASDPSATVGDDVSKIDAALSGRKSCARQLQADERNPSLDVGPNSHPLFTSTSTLSLLPDLIPTTRGSMKKFGEHGSRS
ncbi:hypothetical protein C1H46_023288 [Malus baccata]|uniref:Uncharacterized protein n=1 Tax=Malus baccata TaxID=106549 RepID=A0A540LX86_MALBA|nr:hypothetical protein C1H46_023288 [Malus baccata]